MPFKQISFLTLHFCLPKYRLLFPFFGVLLSCIGIYFAVTVIIAVAIAAVAAFV